MSIADDQRPGYPGKSHRTAAADASQRAPVDYQHIDPRPIMTEAEGTTTREIAVSVTCWDIHMLQSIAEHLGIPEANIASAALNTGLHRAAEVWGIRKIQVDHPWKRQGEATL